MQRESHCDDLNKFNLPVISIIIVVLNCEKKLKRAIESVVNQSYNNWELFIVDGGSTDGTLDVIKPYINRLSYFISQKDNGIYWAMNHALEKCHGDWCIFLGCDDILLDCLHLVAPMLTNKRCIYYGNVIRSSIGDIYCGRFSRLKLTFKNICHQAIFYPKKLFNVKYDTSYRLLADYKHNIVLWGRGVEFKYLPHVISMYNNIGSASAGDEDFAADKSRILLENFGLAYAIMWKIRELLAYIYRKQKNG